MKENYDQKSNSSNKYRIGENCIKNICIVGAGNEGHYLMALLGSNKDLKVSVLTSKADGFQKEIVCHNVQSDEYIVGRLEKASTEPKDVIPMADVVIFTVPTNGCEKYLRKIEPHINRPGVVLVFIPGTGGVEYMAKKLVEEKKCIIVGSQRVPSGTKVTKRGATVDALDKRRDIRIATLPNNYCKDACQFISNTFGIKTIQLPNYLAVTFTPSNAIIHTTRLYALFHGYQDGQEYETRLSLYKQWDVLSSEMLLGCDDELKQCMEKLAMFDFSGLQLLRYHYEIDTIEGSNDVERLTKKMQSLVFLKDFAPMKQTENGKWVPDFGSRYFLEDYPFGLAILKSFCKLCKVETPYMDKVLGWFDKKFKTNYYIDGQFEGDGVRALPVPQNYGINSISELSSFYHSFE